MADLIDDREWIAAYGADTSLAETYHDIPSNNIDVLRSDNGGTVYTQVSQVIPATDYKAMNNELGNVVIDHNNPSGSSFWAYQSFVAPSQDPGITGNSTTMKHSWAYPTMAVLPGPTSPSRAPRRSAAASATQLPERHGGSQRHVVLRRLQRHERLRRQLERSWRQRAARSGEHAWRTPSSRGST